MISPSSDKHFFRFLSGDNNLLINNDRNTINAVITVSSRDIVKIKFCGCGVRDNRKIYKLFELRRFVISVES